MLLLAANQHCQTLKKSHIIRVIVNKYMHSIRFYTVSQKTATTLEGYSLDK